MRVLILDTSGKEGIALGGASIVAANLFNELGKRGIETYYLGYSNGRIGKSPRAFVLRGGRAQATARRMARSGVLNDLAESKFARVMYYIAHSAFGVALGSAAGWVEQVKPDVVIASSIQDYVALKKLRRRLRGAKLVYIEHANASGNYKGALDYNIIGLTFGTGGYAGLEGARRRFFSFFDSIIALNTEQYRNISRYNRDVTIIHSAANIALKRPSAAQVAAARSSAGVRPRDRIVMYLGRLQDEQKNVSALILAVKAIRSDSMKLLIIGNGRSESLYKDMSKGDQRIRIIPGGMTDMEVAAYYSIADLYVLPSLWESFNATIIEAAHFGTGLLLSSKAVNEDMKNRFGRALYTFEPGDVSELKRKIERYFSDGTLRARLRKLSSEIDREYGRKRQMDAYADALERLYRTGRISGQSTS
ncbi:MAG: glycosyltransferase family 4 protein [Candidatus Marsarchaeota archaeon]|jgi:glycosyltransferase involved in cell wall biosynthesis|nr:glycosyltransferase family 4 protein [Candidatus Marsarchaeota archaeon]MCL5111954.1 glycosyltransferase family 4 protein [Candidatus Marsarchaeota archaeon]